MRKLLSFLLVVCIAVSCACVAYGEGGAQSKAFSPMPELTPVKIVVGYNEAALGGHLPSENYWLSVIKDYLNIDVQYMWEVPDVQYSAKLSNSLASGQYPDFISVDAATYKMLLEADALVDLTDLWNEYASDAIKRSFAKVDEVWSSVTVDGKLMAIPYYGDPAQNMNIMYYRQDWLDRVNMEVPTSFEDFIKVVKAFRDNDPDGNGEKDTYGMVLTANPFTTSISYLPIFYAFNAYPGSWILKDGKVVNGNVQPEVKAALDCLRELYKEDYIDPEFATLAYDQAYADVTAGNAGIISHKWYVSCIKNTSYKTVPGIDWIPAPLYTNPNETAKVAMNEMNIGGYTVLLKSAPESARIAFMKMLNMVYDLNYYVTEEAGGSGYDWNYTRVLDANSEEYKAIKDLDLGFPVTLYSPSSVIDECDAYRYYYLNREFPADYYLDDNNKALWQDMVSLVDLKYDDVTEEQMETWSNAQIVKLTRMGNSEREGSYAVATELKKNGSYEMNVYYGDETETGIAISSTLTDEATRFYNRYIMGLEDDSAWDTFVANWYNMGGQQWTDEVNAQYAALH